MAVVDKDGGKLRIRVQCGGYAADIPAVAGGDKRQQPNGGVFGRMEGAGDIGGGNAHRRKRQRVDGISHGAGGEPLFGEVEGDIVADGAIGKPHLVAGDAVGDLDFHVRHPQARGIIDQVIGLAHDANIRSRARGGRILGGLRAGECHIIG